MVTQEKWDKTKALIEEVISWFKDCPDKTADAQPMLDFKRLEQIRGYLCHISMTYDRVTPFLKDFYLTLCKHLPNRNEEGWKLNDQAYHSYLHELLDRDDIGEDAVRS